MEGVVASLLNLAGKWNLLSTHMWEGKVFKLCGQLSLDKIAEKNASLLPQPPLFQQTNPPRIVLDGMQLRVRAEH